MSESGLMEPKPLTVEEFEAAYAERSEVQVDDLHAEGQYAELCDCGEDDCQGWAMLYRRDRR